MNIWRRTVWFAPVRDAEGVRWRAVWNDTITDLQVKVLIFKTRLGPMRREWLPLPSKKAKVVGR